jgi:D-threo-aldose 1-dehydrogenase
LRSLEDSLKRLSLSRIDIVFIHDIDSFTHGPDQPRRFREAMAGAWPALADLRTQGVIGAVGLGVNDWQVCRDALQEADLDGFLLAGRYTLLDQSALHELLPLCLKREASIVIGGPYNSGVLAPISPVRGSSVKAGTPTYDYRPASPQILERVARLREVAAAFGVELAAAALQFALAHRAVVSVIPGARSAAEVQANLCFTQVPVPAAFWQALKDQRLIEPSAPTPTPVAAGADIGPGDLHTT